jgi:hypothetical protein
MKKLSLIAAFGAVALVATAAAANTTLVQDLDSTNSCIEAGLLNQRQVDAGWTCVEETENFSRLIAGGSRCQDATRTTLQAYNPAGNLAEEKTIELDESEWGPSYPVGAGCNHDLI